MTRDFDPSDIASTVFGFARAGDTRRLTAYLDAGVPAGLTNEKGDSLLMLAAYHGHADAVEALAVRGAEVNQLNDRGQSPLAGAVFKTEDAVVDVLLRYGADPGVGSPSAIDVSTMFNMTAYQERFQRNGSS